MATVSLLQFVMLFANVTLFFSCSFQVWHSFFVVVRTFVIEKVDNYFHLDRTDRF